MRKVTYKKGLAYFGRPGRKVVIRILVCLFWEPGQVVNQAGSGNSFRFTVV